MEKKRIFFPDLDLLRTIACMLVLVAHIVWDGLEPYLPAAMKTSFFSFFLGNGGLGVQIFFTLSGFLITYLLLQEKDTAGAVNARNFYIRRVLRIWPLYFLVVGFAFIVYPALKHFMGVGSTGMEQPMYYITFLGNFDVIRILGLPDASLNSMSAITWSVAIEEQFYLFWPLLFILLSTRKVIGAMAAIFVLSGAFILTSKLNGLQIYYHTLANFLFLSTGGMLAWLYTYREKLVRKLAGGQAASRYILLLVMLAVLIFTKDYLVASRPGFLVYWLLTAGTISLFIMQLMLNPTSYAKRYEKSFWVTAGKYTYGLYMYHRIAQWAVSVAVGKLAPTGGLAVVLVQIILCFVLVIIMSVLSYKYFEKPALEIKKRFALFVKN